jgi:hypothetical protein
MRGRLLFVLFIIVIQIIILIRVSQWDLFDSALERPPPSALDFPFSSQGSRSTPTSRVPRRKSASASCHLIDAKAPSLLAGI